jgi:hypothetical protein
VRSTCTFGPLLVAALRCVGVMLILVALVAPDLAAALGPKAPAQPSLAVAPPVSHDDEGGACGDDEETFEELIDCGADLEVRLDEPWAIALLRTTEVRMTAQQCQELLTDIWSQQSCSASGRDCGKVLAGGVQTSGFELVSSSASGHVSLAAHGLAGASSRRLGRPTDERIPRLHDLLPPVPPPRLATR